MDERIQHILTKVAKECLVIDEEYKIHCVFCNDCRDMRDETSILKHEIDCETFLARMILYEQGIQIHTYRISFEVRECTQSTPTLSMRDRSQRWKPCQIIATGYSLEEVIRLYPEVSEPCPDRRNVKIEKVVHPS